MIKKLAAEFLGTFWLVVGGCGAAIFSAGVPNLGIGLLGVAFAFGLSVLTMAYTFGHVSGAHFNPAVTVGLWASGRFPLMEVPFYVVTQVVGAIAGTALLYYIASGVPGFNTAGSFASNGYGTHSPAGFDLFSCAATEFTLTFGFLVVIVGATSKRAPVGFAPIAIGLALTLIHLVSIPITNTSVNPARSTGPALFAGAQSEALGQLWLFWVAPLLGALAAGFLMRWLATDTVETVEQAAEAL
jgi:aquaporin Z